MEIGTTGSRDVCPQKIEEALRIIRPTGEIILCSIHRNGSAPLAKTFLMPEQAEAAAHWAFTQNQKDNNLYWLVNSSGIKNRKPKKDNMTFAHFLFADCDPPIQKMGDYQKAREYLLDTLVPLLKQTASFIIDSGNGIDPFFRLDEPLSLADGYERYEAINQRIGIELEGPGTFNCDRIMRLPGTWNYPNSTKLAKGYPAEPSIARMLFVSDKTYSWETVLGWVSDNTGEQQELTESVQTEKVDPPRDVPPKPSRRTDPNLKQRFQAFLQSVPAAQQRYVGDTEGLHDKSGSAMDFSMVAMLKIGGFSWEECRELLLGWPFGSSDPKRTEDRYWQRAWSRAASEAELDTTHIQPLIDNLRAERQAPTEIPKTKARPFMPEHLLTVPGALGDFVDWINQTARKTEPNFAVQTALALGAVLMGRRYRTNNDNWPALYFLNIADSGSGKEHIKKTIEDVLREAGLGDLLGFSRFTSEAAVLSALTQKPAQISIFDEFGKLLKSAQGAWNHEYSTIKALTEAWGRVNGTQLPTGYSTVGANKNLIDDMNREIINPSLTLMAMTVPGPFFDVMTSENVEDGFLNRFLIAFSDEELKPSRRVPAIPPPQSVIDWAISVRQHLPEGNLTAFTPDIATEKPTPTEMTFSTEAEALFDEFENVRILEKRKELHRAGSSLKDFYLRANEIAMRVSMIVAASNGRMTTIEAQDAQWAIEYVWTLAERAEITLQSSLSDSDYDALIKQVLSIIRQAGEKGMAKWELQQCSRLFRKADQRKRDDCLKSLLSDGLITEKAFPNINGKGKVRKGYVATE